MRRRASAVATLLVAAALVAGCSRQDPARAIGRATTPTGFDLSAVRRLIEAQNERFTRAHVAGDSATIDAMFTRDATSFPPGADPAVGLAAIRELTMEYLKAGVTAFREETTDFYGNEDIVIDQGTYAMTYGPDRVVERGKYLNVWTREDGVWKIRTNIWNTGPSPPAAQ